SRELNAGGHQTCTLAAIRSARESCTATNPADRPGNPVGLSPPLVGDGHGFGPGSAQEPTESAVGEGMPLHQDRDADAITTLELRVPPPPGPHLGLKPVPP